MQNKCISPKKVVILRYKYLIFRILYLIYYENFITFVENLRTMRELTQKRNKDLCDVYRKLVKTVPDFVCIKRMSTYEDVLKQGAPQFYLELDTARLYIQYRKKGEYPPQVSCPLRRQMCDDLYETYKKIKEEHPNWYEQDIVYKTINSPAPSFYIKKEAVQKIISNGNRK